MHGVAMGHTRQRVAPAQRDPVWIAEHETRGKEWEIERESLERAWSSSVGMLMLTFLWKACGLWMLCWYTHLSKFCVTSEKNTDGCKRKSIAKKKENPLEISLLPQLSVVSAAVLGGRSSRRSLQSVQEKKLTLYFLRYDIEGSHINVGENGAMDWKGETDRQNESISSLTEESSGGNM